MLPLPVHDLVAAANADDAVARALLAEHNPVLEAHWIRAKVEALIAVLVARGLSPTDAERRRLFAGRDAATVERWLSAVATCRDAAELLDDNSRR